MLCTPAKAIKNPAEAWPRMEAASQEVELMLAANCKIFRGINCAMMALEVGPTNALIMPEKNMMA